MENGNLILIMHAEYRYIEKYNITDLHIHLDGTSHNTYKFTWFPYF